MTNLLFHLPIYDVLASCSAAVGEAPSLDESAAMTIAIALGAGMLSQAVAHHVKIPGIVVLLFVGVLLGPDVLNIINPDSLGTALITVVGFAVAVILFEGGMELNIRHVLREGRAIRGLVTVGALISVVLGTVAAKVAFDWPWLLAGLFGTLMMVTGPTVINPLVKRIRLEKRTTTVLEAEGIIVDALGAVAAVVVLEFALEVMGSGYSAGAPVLEAFDLSGMVFMRLGVGAGVGLIGGLMLVFLLQYRNLIPEGSENVFILAQVMLVFQVSNFLEPESGVAAAIVAGTVVGNFNSHTHQELREFKEQLTMMFIALLFILLAADVRLADVKALGWPGLAVVAFLMLVIRPLGVTLSTLGSDLTRKQKIFIACIGPRGIIAAAVASFFAVSLEEKGIGGGVELRALIFLVIATTVIIAGFTGGWLANQLGLQRPKDSGWVILGSNALGRTMAHSLQDGGEEVLCIDSSAIIARQARMEGLDVIVGNALEDEMLEKADVGIRRGVIGCTPNEEVNLLFGRKSKAHTGLRRLLVAVRTLDEGITPAMVEQAGGQMLFGVCADIRMWTEQIRRGLTAKEQWRYDNDGNNIPITEVISADSSSLALVVHRDDMIEPVDSSTQISQGDTVTFVVNEERRPDAEDRLRGVGWVPVQQPASASESPDNASNPETAANNVLGPEAL